MHDLLQAAIRRARFTRPPPPPKQIPIIEVAPAAEPIAVTVAIPTPKLSPYPKVKEIVAVVARRYGVTDLDVVSQRRTATVVRPRQIVCYLAKMLTPLSLPQIGNAIGGRDHTTVLHAVRKITGLSGGDPVLNDELTQLSSRLMEGRRAVD